MAVFRQLFVTVILLLGLGAATFTDEIEMRDANGVSLPVELKRFSRLTRPKARKRVTYEDSYCGATISSPSSGLFKSVHAAWTVPTFTVSGGASSSTSSLEQWVGIDSYPGTCAGSVLAGTSLDTSTTGTHSYYTWYEFYPNYAYTATLPIAAGDQVTVTITAVSTTSVTITFVNVTRGLTVSVQASSTASSPLCLQNVEWISEFDIAEGATGPQPAVFDFLSCQATTSTGAVENLANAVIVDPLTISPPECSATEISTTDLRIKYTFT